jgi:hypothetical protein
VEINQYGCYVLGHYPSSSLYLKTVLFFPSKHYFSETGFCLRPRAKPTLFGPIDKANPYLRRGYWFQHDGAPTHCTNVLCEYLDETFGDIWNGRGGPITWPPRSPDLTPLDLFLWRTCKAWWYETRPDLVARIAVAAGTIREMA